MGLFKTAYELETQNTPSENKDDGNVVKDLSHSLGSGLDTLGQTIGKGFSALGAEESGEWIQDLYKEQQKKQYEGMSDDYHQGATEGEWYNPAKIAHTVTGSLPAAALGMGVGAGIAGGLANTGLMSSTAAGITGMGMGEGGVAGAMTASNVHDRIMQAPEEQLTQSKEFQENYWSLSDNLPEEERRQKAREETAKDAAIQTGIAAGGSTFAFGAPSGHYAGKLIGGEVGERLGTTMLKSSALESFEEAPQEASQTVIENMAENRYGGADKPITEGIGEATALGAVAGGVTGGGFGGALHSINKGIMKKQDAVANSIADKEEAHIQKLLEDEDVKNAEIEAKKVLDNGKVVDQDGNERSITDDEVKVIRDNFPAMWQRFVEEDSQSQEQQQYKQGLIERLGQHRPNSIQPQDILNLGQRKIDEAQTELDTINKRLGSNELTPNQRKKLHEKADQLENQITEDEQAIEEIGGMYSQVPLPFLEHILSAQRPAVAAESLRERVFNQNQARSQAQGYKKGTQTGQPVPYRTNTKEQQVKEKLQNKKRSAIIDPQARERAEQETQINKDRQEAGQETTQAEEQPAKQQSVLSKLATKRVQKKINNTKQQITKAKKRLKSNKDKPAKQRELHEKLDNLEQRLEQENQAFQYIQENVDRAPMDYVLQTVQKNNPVDAARQVQRRLAEEQITRQRVEERPTEEASPKRGPVPANTRTPETGQPEMNSIPAPPVTPQEQGTQQTQQGQPEPEPKAQEQNQQKGAQKANKLPTEAALKRTKVSRLREIAQEQGVSPEGKKADLIERILNGDQAQQSTPETQTVKQKTTTNTQVEKASLAYDKENVTDEEINAASREQIEQTLKDIQSDHFRGLSNPQKDVIRKFTKTGELNLEEGRKVVKAHRDYWKQRRQTEEESDAQRKERLEKQYGNKSLEELYKERERLQNEVNKNMQTGQGEVTDGRRSTKKATSSQAGRDYGQTLMELDSYIKEREAQAEQETQSTEQGKEIKIWARHKGQGPYTILTGNQKPQKINPTDKVEFLGSVSKEQLDEVNRYNYKESLQDFKERIQKLNKKSTQFESKQKNKQETQSTDQEATKQRNEKADTTNKKLLNEDKGEPWFQVMQDLYNRTKPNKYGNRIVTDKKIKNAVDKFNKQAEQQGGRGTTPAELKNSKKFWTLNNVDGEPGKFYLSKEFKDSDLETDTQSKPQTSSDKSNETTQEKEPWFQVLEDLYSRAKKDNSGNRYVSDLQIRNAKYKYNKKAREAGTKPFPESKAMSIYNPPHSWNLEKTESGGNTYYISRLDNNTETQTETNEEQHQKKVQEAKKAVKQKEEQDQKETEAKKESDNNKSKERKELEQKGLTNKGDVSVKVIEHPNASGYTVQSTYKGNREIDTSNSGLNIQEAQDLALKYLEEPINKEANFPYKSDAPAKGGQGIEESVYQYFRDGLGIKKFPNDIRIGNARFVKEGQTRESYVQEARKETTKQLNELEEKFKSNDQDTINEAIQELNDLQSKIQAHEEIAKDLDGFLSKPQDNQLGRLIQKKKQKGKPSNKNEQTTQQTEKKQSTESDTSNQIDAITEEIANSKVKENYRILFEDDSDGNTILQVKKKGQKKGNWNTLKSDGPNQLPLEFNTDEFISKLKKHGIDDTEIENMVEKKYKDFNDVKIRRPSYKQITRQGMRDKDGDELTAWAEVEYTDKFGEKQKGYIVPHLFQAKQMPSYPKRKIVNRDDMTMEPVLSKVDSNNPKLKPIAEVNEFQGSDQNNLLALKKKNSEETIYVKKADYSHIVKEFENKSGTLQFTQEADSIQSPIGVYASGEVDPVAVFMPIESSDNNLTPSMIESKVNEQGSKKLSQRINNIDAESTTKTESKQTTQSTEESETPPYKMTLDEYDGDIKSHMDSIKSALKNGELSPEDAFELHGEKYSIRTWPEYREVAKPKSDQDGQIDENVDDAAEAIVNILDGKNAKFKDTSKNSKIKQSVKKRTGMDVTKEGITTKTDDSTKANILDLIFENVRSKKRDPQVVEQVRKTFGEHAEVKEMESGDIIVRTKRGKVIVIRPNRTIRFQGDEKMGMTQGPELLSQATGHKFENSAVITLSKDFKENQKQTLNHEIYHAAKSLALTPGQSKLLDQKFKDEEAQAEAYENWNGHSKPKHPYFRKIKNTFSGVNRIFNQIQSGKVWEQAQSPEVDTNKPKFKSDNPLMPEYNLSYEPENEGILGQAYDDLEALQMDHVAPMFKARDKMIKRHPDKKETLEKVGTSKSETWLESSKNSIRQHFTVEKIVDRYHPIKQLVKAFEGQTGIKLPRRLSPYISKRLSTSVGVTINNFLHHGKASWENGTVQSRGVNEGLLKILEPLGDSLYPYLYRRIVTRSDKLRAEGREQLITDEVRKDLVDIYTQYEDKQLWNKIDKQLGELQQNIVQVAVDAGIISKDLANDFDYVSYIPFYRLMQDEAGDETVLGPQLNKRFINNGIRKLRGSDKAMNDPLQNIIQNWTHLIGESIQNDTLQKAISIAEDTDWNGQPLAEEVPANMKNNPNTLGVKIEGETVYYKIQDASIFNALTDMNKEHLNNTLAKILRGSKHALTYGATFGPAFRLANAFRDSLHVAIMQGSTFSAFMDTWRGMQKIRKNDSLYRELQSAGGTFSGGYLRSGDPQDLSAEIGKLTIGQKRAKYSPLHLLDMWQQVGDAFENAARVQLYSKLRDGGASIPDAAYQAKDLLDFTLSGSSSTMQWAIQAIPFLNARMQGLYKIGKEAHLQENTNRSTMGKIGSIYAIASLAMLGLSRSGEDNKNKYDSLPDYEKFMYHNLFLGDTHIRLPMPFELGAIFGAAPVALAEAIFGEEDADHFFQFMGHTIGSTLNINPVPQIARPLVEQWANKDFFTGREIIPIGMQNLKPTEQADPWTSKTLKLYADAVDKTGLDKVFTGYFEFLQSPKRLENLIRDYFATIGTGTLGMTDMMLDWAGVGPDDPALSIQDYPAIGRFVRAGPVRRSGYTQDAYDMIKQIDEINSTARHLRQIGQPEKAREWLQENQDTLRNEGMAKALRKQLATVRKRQRLVWNNRQIGSKEKREQLRRLTEQRNKIVGQYIDRIRLK